MGEPERARKLFAAGLERCPDHVHLHQVQTTPLLPRSTSFGPFLCLLDRVRLHEVQTTPLSCHPEVPSKTIPLSSRLFGDIYHCSKLLFCARIAHPLLSAVYFKSQPLYSVRAQALTSKSEAHMSCCLPCGIRLGCQGYTGQSRKAEEPRSCTQAWPQQMPLCFV